MKNKVDLIPKKVEQELISIITPLDPERAESALRVVTEVIINMIRDLSSHKPCDEKRAWIIEEGHKKKLIERFNKLFPEKPEGINEAVNSCINLMKQVVLSHKGKTWN